MLQSSLKNINTMDAKGKFWLPSWLHSPNRKIMSPYPQTNGIQRYQQGKVFVNYNHFLGYTKDAQGKLVIEPESKVIKRIFYATLMEWP